MRKRESLWMAGFWINQVCLRHFLVKSARSLCFWVVPSWFQKVWSCVPGGPWRSGEAKSFKRCPEICGRCLGRLSA